MKIIPGKGYLVAQIPPLPEMRAIGGSGDKKIVAPASSIVRYNVEKGRLGVVVATGDAHVAGTPKIGDIVMLPPLAVGSITVRGKEYVRVQTEQVTLVDLDGDMPDVRQQEDAIRQFMLNTEAALSSKPDGIDAGLFQ